MLFFDGPDQRLSLFFILGDVLLMLFDAVLIALSRWTISLVEYLKLPNQLGVLFFEFLNFFLELLISESWWLDVLRDHFLDLNYLLHDPLNLNWSLDVNRLHSDLSLQLFAVF